MIVTPGTTFSFLYYLLFFHYSLLLKISPVQVKATAIRPQAKTENVKKKKESTKSTEKTKRKTRRIKNIRRTRRRRKRKKRRRRKRKKKKKKRREQSRHGAHMEFSGTLITISVLLLLLLVNTFIITEWVTCLESNKSLNCGYWK